MSAEHGQDDPDQATGLRPPGLPEAIPLQAALWFESQLDQWQKDPKRVDRINRRMVLLLGGSVATGCSYWFHNSLRLKDKLSAMPRPVETKTGPLEARLEYGQFVAGKQWILANFAPGLAVRVFPEVFQEILDDKLATPKLPADTTVLTVLVGDSLVYEPSKSRLIKFIQEEQGPYILAQSKVMIGDKGPGKAFSKGISVIDRQKIILGVQSSDYYITGLDLSYNWVASVLAVSFGNTATENVVLPELSPEVKQMIIEKSKGKGQTSPIAVEYLEPAYVERAKRL